MIGTIVTATVSRVEPYGVYLDGPDGKIVVLIPDVSATRIENLQEYYTVGDQVRVRIVKYVEERELFKGIIKGVPQP